MKKTTMIRILCFILLAFVPMYGLCAVYSRSGMSALLVLMMFLPAIASLLTRLITHEGFEDMMLNWRWKGNGKRYLFAYFAPPLLAYAGAAVYFLLFPKDFSPLQSAFAVQSSITSADDYIKTLLVMVPLAIVVNPLMGIVPCLGEELGWRGYLLPKLSESFSPLASAALTGVVWGIWHAPLIALGYNYGSEHPAAGILAMVVFCTCIGLISGFLAYQTRSIWPAVLFHAAINGMDKWPASLLLMSKQPNMFVGPDLLGIIGGLGFLVADIFIICSMHKNMAGMVLGNNV